MIAVSEYAFRFAALQPDDPAQVGRYPLRARLGSGGMGRVYLSFTPGGLPLAVKVVAPALDQDPQAAERFAREVRVTQSVDGNHVARILDADVDAPRPWLASAYVPGPALDELVADTGPLPAADTLLIALGMARALTAIHAAGVVHRDVKPANVILDEAGPKIIDFGIVTSLTEPATADADAARIGTLPYMSPEQARGRPVGPSSDIFSLGSTIYFLATGRAAFDADDEFETVYRIIHEEPDLSAVHPRLCRVLRACLAKDPKRRPTPVQVAAICADELGPLAPGAYLSISQATASIRARTDALRELLAESSAETRREPGPETEPGPSRPYQGTTWSTPNAKS